MKEAASTRTSNKRKPKVQNAESDCDTSDDADGNDDQWGGIAEDSGSSQSDSDVNNSHVVEDVHAQAIRLPSHLPDSLFMEAAASEKMQSTSTTSKLVKNGKKRRLKKSKSSGTRSERVVGSVISATSHLHLRL